MGLDQVKEHFSQVFEGYQVDEHYGLLCRSNEKTRKDFNLSEIENVLDESLETFGAVITIEPYSYTIGYLNGLWYMVAWHDNAFYASTPHKQDILNTIKILTLKRNRTINLQYDLWIISWYINK